ncbi:hypothetical protein EDC04DRAFT_2608002 [Pisolithus marmoratus]|nr:hypothetical protein EDC04DRAFT_2608002 [Pisolithus marmoratus]
MVVVQEDNQMDWMDDLERGRQSPPPYIPDTEDDTADMLDDLSQIPPVMPSPTSFRESLDPPVILTLTDDVPLDSVEDDTGDNTDDFDDLESSQFIQSSDAEAASPAAATPSAPEDDLHRVELSPPFEPIPSDAEQMEMEHEGLVNSGVDEKVFCTVYELKLWHRHTHLHYDFGFNARLDKHIVEAMRWIVDDLRYSAKKQIDLIEEAQRALQILDVMEASEDPYRSLGFEWYMGRDDNAAQHSVAEMVIVYLGCCIETAALHLLTMPQLADWPRFWFNTIFLEMHLTDLLPLAVLHTSHPPPPPACYHSYLHGGWTEDMFHEELLHIPISTFKMIDHVSCLIPSWTAHGIGKYEGFISLWWLGASEDYRLTASDSNLGAMTGHARTYFKYLQDLEKSIEQLSHDIDHMFSCLVSLSGIAAIFHQYNCGRDSKPLRIIKIKTHNDAEIRDELQQYSNVHRILGSLPMATGGCIM